MSRTVLISGATKGIGRALSERLARQGQRVIGIDTMPPHRRPLGPRPCWPAPPSQVNLARWVWLPHDNPKDILATDRAYRQRAGHRAGHEVERRRRRGVRSARDC